MFYGAAAFNQNLKCWNVKQITDPFNYYNFAVNSGFASDTDLHPLWGQDPLCGAAPVVDLFTDTGGDNNISRTAESFGEDTVAFVSGDTPVTADVETLQKLTVSIPTAQLDGGDWIDYLVIGDWDAYVDLAQDSANQDYSVV